MRYLNYIEALKALQEELNLSLSLDRLLFILFKYRENFN